MQLDIFPATKHSNNNVFNPFCFDGQIATLGKIFKLIGLVWFGFMAYQPL